MTDEREFRIVQDTQGFCVREVYLKDGKPSAYTDDDLWLGASTLDELRAMIKEIAAACDKPVLSEADDFPDQDRPDFSKFLEHVEKWRNKPK